MTDNVIQFPKLSRLDEQFIRLEKQKEQILKQREEIDARLDKR